MKRCETCKYMAAPRSHEGLIRYDDDSNEFKSEHRSCVRIIHGNGYDDRNEAETFNEPAVVTDGSGYAARLLVLPSFGCVLHEEKE